MTNYKKGEQVKSLLEFVNRATQPCMYGDHPLFYVGRIPRALTWGFLQHWTFSTIQGAIDIGGLWVAEKIEKTEGVALEENNTGGAR